MTVYCRAVCPHVAIYIVNGQIDDHVTVHVHVHFGYSACSTF